MPLSVLIIVLLFLLLLGGAVPWQSAPLPPPQSMPGRPGVPVPPQPTPGPPAGPGYGYWHWYGYGPIVPGGLGTLLVIILVLALIGVF